MTNQLLQKAENEFKGKECSCNYCGDFFKNDYNIWQAIKPQISEQSSWASLLHTVLLVQSPNVLYQWAASPVCLITYYNVVLMLLLNEEECEWKWKVLHSCTASTLLNVPLAWRGSHRFFFFCFFVSDCQEQTVTYGLGGTESPRRPGGHSLGHHIGQSISFK